MSTKRNKFRGTDRQTHKDYEISRKSDKSDKFSNQGQIFKKYKFFKKKYFSKNCHIYTQMQNCQK